MSKDEKIALGAVLVALLAAGATAYAKEARYRATLDANLKKETAPNAATILRLNGLD